MASHSNTTEAHDFYYLGVNEGRHKEYAGCTVSYQADQAFSYSTVVARVIPTRGLKAGDIHTSKPDTGLTLLSYYSMSSTTGRHISNIGSASPFSVVRVPMERGRRDLTPGLVRDGLLEALADYAAGLNKAENRESFVTLLAARKTILDKAAEAWAAPLRDKRFKKFEAIDVSAAAEALKAKRRKAAAKAAAETKALFAKYVNNRGGADYCEFLRVLFDPMYLTDKFPFNADQRRILKARLDRNAAYVWPEDNDTIRTSKGIRVDARQARVLLKAWAMGKDMRTQRIGNYTIVSYTGNTIKIGCHSIPRANMLALYEALVGEPFPEKPAGADGAEKQDAT